MNDADRLPFFELLDTTYELIGKTAAAKVISAKAKKMFFKDMERFPFELIEWAIEAHRNDPAVGHFTPSPAHITAQIEKRRTVMWLSADEAWAQVPKLEGEPGLLNDVSAQALAVAAQFINQPKPDMTAARMAFKGCYDRLVDRAKLERRGPVYFVSPGGSYEDQQAVIEEGVRQGLLAAPPKVPDVALLGTRTKGAKPDLKALLLTMQTKAMPPPEGQDYE